MLGHFGFFTYTEVLASFSCTQDPLEVPFPGVGHTSPLEPQPSPPLWDLGELELQQQVEEGHPTPHTPAPAHRVSLKIREVQTEALCKLQ